MKITTRVKTITKRVFVGLLTLVLALGGLAYAFQRKFKSPIPAPNFEAPKNSTEANQQDLEYFQTVFPRADRSFSQEQRTQFQIEVAALLSRTNSLTRGELAMGIAHASALSNNGHTGLSTTRFRHVPVRFWWFADGLYILQTDAQNSDLLAARVVRIQGHTPEDVLEQLRAYIPGNGGHKRVECTYFLDSPEALQGIGLGDSTTAITFDLDTADGKSITRTLESGPVNPEPEIDPRFPHSPDCSVTCDWPNVWGSEEGPLYTQQASGGYFRSWLNDLHALYIRLYAIEDTGVQPIAQFLSETLADAKSRKPTNLIVDLRGNQGGNYFTVRSFTKEIVNVVPGQVFIVTDAGTFSAAVVTTAYLKHYAGARAHIVGEHVGDFEQFWAEGPDTIKLPNSTFRIGVATGYHDWEHGCADVTKCYWPNVLFGVAAGKLDPDLPVAATFAAFRSGRDESLERIHTHLAGRQ